MLLKMNKLTAITAILSLIGCFPLPIGYYTFLRIVICISCIVIIVHDKDRGVNITNILWAVVAVLFNPIFPVYLHEKAIWIVLDIIAAILFGVKTYQLTRKN